MMRLILDACTLIYIVKAKLTKEFVKICDDEVAIDTEVYKEVIEQGKAKNYPDANLA